MKIAVGAIMAIVIMGLGVGLATSSVGWGLAVFGAGFLVAELEL
jgi:hypothetical protein